MKLMKRKDTSEAVRVSIGFAAGDRSDGVAYAAIGENTLMPATVARVAFHCTRLPALEGRDAAYAAMLAVAEELLRRKISRVAFEIDCEALVRDMTDHRQVPPALSVPYVMLGCALNRFASVQLIVACGATCRDLTARARAEVSLHVAA